ncbi:MAG: hypothetical protein A2735_00295 [Candidatus Yanofskybacteria bacterium RIFCSPHIGHO2_01_FULL_41_21]|uniref:Endonuclease NucS C-terminal domain-containing protein n=1 Tax=Candidatus Yanofskybacteria bacterium RIFCSPHIGHO2_01_FULL_41_21 TaxID=1802660 RepID=A0A1F8EB64_9BACT|nr:MAG: hypothetical protein A2735_00295 [Candidatus Yanofskybacteria bacterium RIFCSPHIGHO2_01_FULL_41_21]
MEKEKILRQFQDFLVSYNAVQKDEIWQKQSNIFRTFWNQRVLNDQVKELDDFEIDNVIRLIDYNSKGKKAGDEAVAKVMIPQGVWRKMFNQFKTDKKLAQLVDQIMGTFEQDKRIKLIDELYKYNEPYRNSLTGQSGNAVNSFIFLWAPLKNISIISLKDRQKLIQFLDVQNGPNFENDSTAKKIVESNDSLASSFAKIFGSQYSPRTICSFFYSPLIKNEWRSEDIGEETVPWGGWKKSPEEDFAPIIAESSMLGDPALFYMESQLEDFLIENWDKTELGQKYDLIEEEGEVVSQQYRTGVGLIDILARDKKTKQLVVIELKKNQTSDDTVGQLARYMGWLEENKTNGKLTKGIIIAAQYDQRLYYALKKMQDAEVYLYRVDFKLTEFKDGSK